MALADVVSSGSRLQALEALRDRLARDIDETDSKRDVAALSQRLMDVLSQIDTLRGQAPSQVEVTGLSAFEKKLAERGDGPAARPRRAAR